MNSFGKYFKVTIFGESHGPAIGVTIDGVPGNIPLYEDEFEKDIARRAPGGKGTTKRKEADRARVLSGAYNGLTTGAPLTIIFWNSNVESQDYLKFDDMPRPGHADLVANIKYNFANDPRRRTFFRPPYTTHCSCGVVAKQILKFHFNPDLEEEMRRRRGGFFQTPA